MPALAVAHLTGFTAFGVVMPCCNQNLIAGELLTEVSLRAGVRDAHHVLPAVPGPHADPQAHAPEVRPRRGALQRLSRHRVVCARCCRLSARAPCHCAMLLHCLCADSLSSHSCAVKLLSPIVQTIGVPALCHVPWAVVDGDLDAACLHGTSAGATRAPSARRPSKSRCVSLSSCRAHKTAATRVTFC